MHWAIGTSNKAKIACVESTVIRLFPSATHRLSAVPVSSAVAAQPLSDHETMQGALHRATVALAAVPEAQFGVGLEGGVQQIGELWFECGWICVKERASGRLGWGSSGRYQMSAKLMGPILTEKKELAEVIDNLSGQRDVRSNSGAMGVLTNNHLARAEAYSHGLIFALAPFLSGPQYWDGC